MKIRKHLTSPGTRWYGQETIKSACGKRVSAHDARPEGEVTCAACLEAAAQTLKMTRDMHIKHPEISSVSNAAGVCGLY